MDNIELLSGNDPVFKNFREENYKKFNSIDWFTPKEDWRRFNVTNFTLKTPELKIEKKLKPKIEEELEGEFLAKINFIGPFLKKYRKIKP